MAEAERFETIFEQTEGFLDRHPIVRKLIKPVAEVVVGIAISIDEELRTEFVDNVYLDVEASGVYPDYLRGIERFSFGEARRGISQAVSSGREEFLNVGDHALIESIRRMRG